MKTIQRLLLSKYLILIVFTFLLSFYSKADQLMWFPLTSVSNFNSTALGIQTGTISTNATNPTFDATRLASNGWNSTNPYRYYETSVIDTRNFYNIKVSAYLWSNTLGPRDIQLQYKIGSGGSWTSVADFVLNNSATNREAILPEVCNNQEVLYVRWIATSNTNIAEPPGTVGSNNTTNRTFIHSASIVGDQPAVPNTQASSIKFVAITSKTIRVSFSTGNSDRFVVVMNAEENFTLNPDDNDNPTANSTYNDITGGEQVVYNGTGTFEIVTVESSANVYWFRVYGYKYNGGMTRYVVTNIEGVDVRNPEAVDNPRKCELEEITINPVTDIRLIRATFNAEISTMKNEITDRGFVWSLTSGSNFNFSQLFYEGVGDDGPFSMGFPDVNLGTEVLPRGKTIYVKAFVDGIAGRSYTDEISFSNVPVFTSTGNWETASLWNVQEVPGEEGDVTYGSADDSPIIDANCTLNVSNLVTNLTINSGKNLTINTGALGTGNQLTVDGTLTNNAGTSGILLKSGEDLANGTLTWGSGTVQGSVQMYSLAAKPTDFKWQYFGIPVASFSLAKPGPTTPSPVAGSYIRKMYESGTTSAKRWISQTNDSIMEAFKGYEITQNDAKTITFTGTLNHGDYTTDPLSYTAASIRRGQHLIGNSFTAAININEILFGEEGDVDLAVTLYKTGSSDDWLAGGRGNPATPGSEGIGQYITVPIGEAGDGLLPAEIPSMQAFIVKVNDDGGNTVTIPLSALVTNTTAQRAPAAKKPFVRINVTTDSLYSDIMWLISNPNSTHGYENGYDGKKYISDIIAAPQLYAKEASGNYQVNSVNDFNNTNLGFVAGEDENYTFTFTSDNLDMEYPALYLYDMETNDMVDITTSGTQYSFTATPNSTVTNRFKILTSPDLTTGGMLVADDVLKVYSADNQIIVENSSRSNATFNLFDLAGRIIATQTIDGNSTTKINANLKSGIYVSKTTISNSGLELISKIHLKN